MSDDAAFHRDRVTALLRRVCNGDEAAFNALVPLVYDDLRRRARTWLRKDGVRYGFDPRELVHETYLRLRDQRHKCWDNPAHFMAVCATAMRRVLLDQVRRHRRSKRGHDRVLSMDVDLLHAGIIVPSVQDLDHTLARLAAHNVRAERVVELKVFGGMKLLEIADVLNVSVATVKRDWALARAWLGRELQ